MDNPTVRAFKDIAQFLIDTDEWPECKSDLELIILSMTSLSPDDRERCLNFLPED